MSIDDWCRRHRHWPVPAQHDALRRKLQGHYNYFAVRGNGRSVNLVAYRANRSWLKWLRRRSQRSRRNWDRFNDLMRDFPLPVPRIKRSIWATVP